MFKSSCSTHVQLNFAYDQFFICDGSSSPYWPNYYPAYFIFLLITFHQEQRPTRSAKLCRFFPPSIFPAHKNRVSAIFIRERLLSVWKKKEKKCSVPFLTQKTIKISVYDRSAGTHFYSNDFFFSPIFFFSVS